VLVRLPGEENIESITGLLDLALDPNTSAWELDSHGTWTRNEGAVHLQETFIERQRRRRTSS